MHISENIILPAEWEPQDAIMLTWPHASTDWAYMLPEVEAAYIEIARNIIRFEKLLIVGHDRQAILRHFTPREQKQITLYEIASNDTWARDHGPICTFKNGIPVVNDFGFNGWGNKFDATLDNMINVGLHKMGAFGPQVAFHDHHNFYLEGGSIESDGAGTILTTSACLLNPNRNGIITREEAEYQLKTTLGATRILWVDHGHLEGDDTDSHIDTLARFCPGNTICYVRCADPADEHFNDLLAMEEQLYTLRTAHGTPYNLVSLPMADAIYDEDYHRLPATYANFLITNNAVLVPVYQQDNDIEAINILSKVFTDRQVIAINCLPLIKQNGSLHCITMQIPKGFLI